VAKAQNWALEPQGKKRHERRVHIVTKEQRNKIEIL
jgi:hypothetical protein